MASKKSNKKAETVINETFPCPLYGWGSVDEVAAEIKSSIHAQLLQGQFILAARGDWELQRLIVTRRIDNPELYMIGVICKGWTMLNPRLPKEAILDFVTNDAKEKKVPIGILNDFQKILNNIN
jgi:hypothetical protein